MHAVGIPLDEKYRIEVQGSFQEFALPNFDILRKGQVTIEQDTTSFTIHGFLRKLESIRQNPFRIIDGRGAYLSLLATRQEFRTALRTAKTLDRWSAA